MAVVAERRLPGIRFERRSQPSDLVLPRMDVAAFVGIAASGPLHTPVPVEDAAQFEALFGTDAPLAWDGERGMPTRAYLAPAVRAFFRNGGDRCWIVRVAGDAAESDVFEVPGLARAGPAGLEPALLRARCEGSWADGLRVATALQASTLALVRSSGLRFEFAVSRPDELAVGDLVRITGSAYVLHFAAASVAPVAASPLSGDSRPVLAVEAEPGSVVWLSRATPPPGATGTAVYRGDGGELRSADALVPPQTQPPRFELDLATDAAPRAGSLLRLDAGPARLWLAVAEVRTAEGAGSPVGSGLRVVGELFAPVAEPAAVPSFGPGDLAEKLTFELWVRRGADGTSRLADLGFAAAHPRFVGDLPTDLDLYRSREGEPHRDPPPVWQIAADPRFPLAGPGDAPQAYIPLGMPIVPGPYAGPLAPAAPALVRDGLGTFDDRLFLDDALRDNGVETLITTADFLRFQADRPRSLRGIHALVGLDEPTIVAVPDAVQRPWQETAQPGVPLPEASEPLLRPEWWRFLPCAPPGKPDPAVVPVSEHFLCEARRIPETPALSADEPARNGSYEVRWTAVPEPGVEYVLEEAADPEWSDATVAYRGSDLVRRLESRVGTHFYRVRAAAGDASSDWSNPIAVDAPAREARPVAQPERGHFLDCSTRVLEVPVLEQPTPDPTGGFTVAWLPIAEPDAVYALEEAREPDWSDATEIYRGTGLSLQLFGRALGAYYYRVRAVVGTLSSDWSAGVAVQVAPATRWLRDPAADYRPQALLTVQRALLRLCAARGDMLAVLALPEHYREDDAVSHAGTLRSGTIEDTAPDDQRIFSYGALYHPWLTTPEPNDPQSFRLTPPDGAAAGVLAKRAAARGAWIAPANEPVRDVIVLTPRIRREELGRLQDAQVNVVRQEPRGFLWLSADTLSTDPELRPIGVRRLLSLLRRAALLNGPTYVFEPNDAVLRRSVQRGFEQLLSQLYVRGAFAGSAPDDGFRVVIGSPPNNGATRDAGQLIVELKVAPSLPMAFLTVRLVARGEGGLTVESR